MEINAFLPHYKHKGVNDEKLEPSWNKYQQFTFTNPTLTHEKITIYFLSLSLYNKITLNSLIRYKLKKIFPKNRATNNQCTCFDWVEKSTWVGLNMF